VRAHSCVRSLPALSPSKLSRGSYRSLSAGSIHPSAWKNFANFAFCNTGTVHNWHLELHAPGEFEGYYDEYERIVESEMDEQERRKARVELGERYGVVWHEELIPEVRARFGLEP
jgi:hypothetical protein